MVYDLSAGNAPEPFQTYFAEPAGSTTLSFTKQLALSLPAVQLTHRLARGPNGTDSYVQPFESLQPFARQGTYMQDLKAHRTLYSTAELHPVSDPGVVPLAGVYSYITSIGVSSIPFRELLSTGAKQMIPATATTARVQWSDLWGRRWVEPIRSLFVDVAPLPGPLRNFMMTTTYELLRPNTNERLLQWQSDESLIVRVQMKLKNNYSKFFDITTCAQNGHMVRGGSNPTIDPSNHKSQMLSWIHNTYYGACWQGNPSYLEAQKLTSTQQNNIQQVHLCAENQTFSTGCNGLTDGSLPILERRKGSNATNWNYALYVDQHWPSGYILPNMWDLTHYDYEDSPFLKSYPFHFDNMLPSLDSGLQKPQNIISFPILKGAGYNMAYTPSLTHPKFPQKSGWWSDNLQNQDDTLVAGQADSNTHAVGSTDLTTSVGWVSIDQLSNVSTRSALSNIYVCEFNRQRIVTDPSNNVFTYPTNVVKNNVVPVDPNLSTDNTDLYAYHCDLSQPPYSPNDISSFDNFLKTSTANDYLYFGANLRGGALENINVMYTLDPLDGSKVEGESVVQNGGRFVYWNPGLGPNAFEVVDDVTSVVNAQRTDLNMEVTIFPTTVHTFNAVELQWLHLEDTAEIGRQWTSQAYYNYYGFGDSTVSVYVGGTNGTSVIVAPGQMTTATIEFSNNAGFDWNLYANAMVSIDEGSMPLSANDLLFNMVHAIKVPTQYNFMTVNIPADLQPHITIIPSSYYSKTPPMVFDFSNVNVATIQDGFKADYYYDIFVHSSLPDEYRGRMMHIPITLNPQYFDALPGTAQDPTGVHDYTLSIPDLVIAIPDASGSVSYTSGHAHNIVWSHTINPTFTPQQVQFIDPSIIPQLAQISSNSLEREANLRAFWANLTHTANNSCPFWYKDVGSQRVMYYNISVQGSQFPFPNPAGPEFATVDLLTYSEIPQMPYGWNTVFYNSLATFNDDVGKAKFAQVTTSQQVRATGPWLQISYNATLTNPSLGVKYDNSNLHVTDSGIATVVMQATNVGSDTAYNVNFTLVLGDNMQILSSGFSTPHKLQGKNLTLFTGAYLPPGTPISFTVPINFSALSVAAPARTFIVRAMSAMDLTVTPGENTVSEVLNQSLTLPLVLTSANLTGAPSGYTVNLTLTTDATALGVGLAYTWWRKNVNFGTDQGAQGKWYVLSQSHAVSISDTVSGKSSPEVDYMVSITPANSQLILAQSNVYQFAPKPSRWWLPLAIALPIALAVLALIIAAAVYARRKHPEWFKSDPNKKAKAKPKAKKPKLEPVPSSASFSDVQEEDPNDPRKPAKQYTVNIDYLMTGARRVVVKDGNPTSIKPPEEGEVEEGEDSGNAEMDVEPPKTKKPWIKKLFPCL